MTDKILLGYEDDFWSWFAGFWEGEGSVHFSNNRDGPSRGRIDVSQAVGEPIDYILKATGIGAVCFRRPIHREQDRGTWIWQVDKRREILTIGEKLLPFLRFRAKHMHNFLARIRALDKTAKWHSWTQVELDLLRANYSMLSHAELESQLSRPFRSIKSRAQKLGLKRRLK